MLKIVKLIVKLIVKNTVSILEIEAIESRSGSQLFHKTIYPQSFTIHSPFLIYYNNKQIWNQEKKEQISKKTWRVIT